MSTPSQKSFDPISLNAVSYAHGDFSLKGYLALDAAQAGARPGVLIVPDFMGPETDRVKLYAKQIAAQGYAAFVVDMYGHGRAITSREEAGALMAPMRNDRMLLRARITAAFETLRNDTHVDPQKIAVMGFCFGGGVALEFARTGAALRGAISVHGLLGSPDPDQTSITAKILVLHGAEDPTISAEQITTFMNEMRSANVDWQFMFYGGAKHGFTNPDADKIGSTAVAYHAKVDHRSQLAVREFLAEVFA